jgi:bis(5'-nucleosyl)-tetraphosphatase (symmetrical)
MATWAIGDVQGCFDNLCALLEQIDPADRLWLTGDLVNRGPRSLAVLRWAREQGDRVVTVLGNHDLNLLACAAGVRRVRKSDTIGEVLAAPDRDELLDWLRARPLVYREGDHLLVHAGLLPPWTADDAERIAREVEAALRGPESVRLLESWREAPRTWQENHPDRLALALAAFVTLRCVNQRGAMDRDFDGPPDEAPAGLMPWFDHPARRSREVRVVCGHWAALGLHLRPDLAALDSGCVWGGSLTALRLEDGHVIQVPGLAS